MDDLCTKHKLATHGWLVIPSPDPFMCAENVMATLSGPAMHFLRQKNLGVKVFTKVTMVTPISRGGQVQIVHSDTLANPLIALELHSGAWATYHSLASNKSPQEAIQMATKNNDEDPQLAKDRENIGVTRLHFIFIKPSILGSNRPLPVTSYTYLNTDFVPGMENVSVNSKNRVSSFRDGNIWCPSSNGNIPAAYAGLAKCDYALPHILVDSLMTSIQSSQKFITSEIFAIPLSAISICNSYFLQVTRDQLKAYGEGEYSPDLALDAVMGHIPGGRSAVTLLGSSVKSTNSIIVHISRI